MMIVRSKRSKDWANYTNYVTMNVILRKLPEFTGDDEVDDE